MRDIQHFDVVIVGAGLSGIGAARQLQDKCPGKTFAILEGREAIGGTWDLFRYPGIRSDSDMYTMGYNTKPWLAPKAIADGPSILAYVKEAASERGIDQHIQFDQQVKSAAWSTEQPCWTVETARPKAGASQPTTRLLPPSHPSNLCQSIFSSIRFFLPMNTDLQGRTVVVTGVCVRGLTLANSGGSSPSREIATMMRVRP